MALQIQKAFDEKENKWIIKPIGEIDIYTAPDFKENLLNIINDSEGDMIIDGENLQYIDSTGLGVLISGLKKMREKNRSIIIQNIKPNIEKLFEITGLNKVFIVKGCN